MKPLSWLGILRLALVQTALGSVVVLVTSTLNRVMIVEYSLPAVLPAALVALHYAVQMVRLRFGYGSDVGGRLTPWIIGGMATLALGAVLCALAATGIVRFGWPAILLAILAYAVVGMGVGAAGTSLLVLMAKRVAADRRAPAATIMWTMMIAGFAVTSAIVGRFLDPFTAERLVVVISIASAAALAVAVLAVWKIEVGMVLPARAGTPAATPRTPGSFRAALARVWREPQARSFTIFVFISMLAYSAQELLLEPFAGLVFGFSVGESASLAGKWHAAALLGMISVGVACGGARRFGNLRAWTIGGCCLSAAALLSLAAADLIGPRWPLLVSVLTLGLGNGAFAVAAIASMMQLAHGDATGAGVRMGLWGAAQAVAFALGGVVGALIVDAVRYFFGSPIIAFALVFVTEAALFLAAARLAAGAHVPSMRRSGAPITAVTV